MIELIFSKLSDGSLIQRLIKNAQVTANSEATRPISILGRFQTRIRLACEFNCCLFGSLSSPDALPILYRCLSLDVGRCIASSSLRTTFHEIPRERGKGESEREREREISRHSGYRNLLSERIATALVDGIK